MASKHDELLHLPSRAASDIEMSYTHLASSETVPYVSPLRRAWGGIKDNWKAGGTVALVNLPLSISLAVASSSTPVAGVVTAFWSGLGASIFGGSEYNIVGPTGALSGLLGHLVQRFDVDCLPFVAIIVAIVTFLAYLLKFERYVLLVPVSVMEGFTLGIAFIIAANQLNFAMGLPPLPGQESLIANVIQNLSHSSDANWQAIVMFLASFVMLLGFIKLQPRVPWVMVISFAGILFGWLGANNYMDLTVYTLHSRYGNLDLHVVSIPSFKNAYISWDILFGTIPVAFVAILETLISAKIADKMTKTTFDSSREVLGLGIANLLSGVFGGIPATAALARTALNIKSGAKSRVSGLVNAAAVLVLSLFLLQLFVYLPLPVVAAQVCVVAVRMVDVSSLVHLFRADKYKFSKAMLVAIVCIVKDPTWGICVGFVISLLRFSEKLAYGHSEVILYNQNPAVLVSNEEMDARVNNLTPYGLRPGWDANGFRNAPVDPDFPVAHFQPSEKVALYRVAGALTFVNSQSHLKRLEALQDCDAIIISLRYCFFLDMEGSDVLEDIVEELNSDFSCRVYLTGIGSFLTAALKSKKWYQDKVAAGEVFECGQADIARTKSQY